MQYMLNVSNRSVSSFDYQRKSAIHEAITTSALVWHSLCTRCEKVRSLVFR